MSVDFEITQLADSIRSAPRSKFTVPYPAPIVHRTIALAKRLCPSTYLLNHLANLLGLSPKTITNWLSTKSPAPVMVPVLVSPPPATAVSYQNPHMGSDRNQCKRVIRHWVIGKKNHFGSKSERGTAAASILYTLIKSAEMSGVDPRAYLRMVVVRGKRGQPALLPNQVTREHLVEVGLSEEQAVRALQWRAAQNQKAKRGKMREAAIAPTVACKQAA